MYIQVKLLNGFQQELTYGVPKQWNVDDLLGSIVEVPLQKRLEYAVVTKVFSELPVSIRYTIKDAVSKELIPEDKHYKKFVKQLAQYYACDELFFLKRVRHFLTEKEIEEASSSVTERTSDVLLTQEQQAIVNQIKPEIIQGNYFPALLHGVTGSGKTEIYKQLILQNYECTQSTILLLPEVSLAIQFLKILKKQLPSTIQLFGFHSASSAAEKKTLWQQLLHNKPVVIIGVHLPLLLPIHNLGLIIIDEEHETSFQEKKHPKINTKEAAILRAQIAKIPIILGSATPSITSLYNVKHRNWKLFELKNRFAGSFPLVQLVKLTKETKRPHFWISKELQEAIADRLIKKEQTIIFLNRRGYSFFIQCSDCGHIPMCAQCSVSFTLHENNILKCHYCSQTLQETEKCSACKSTKLLKKGIGTQQVVTILQKLFPQARIDRADLDATVNKKKWQKVVTDFESKELDILVGTQTITKGYHFPGVTLVGILWADINLSLPFYNCAENTLQQLIQVAGRAGRQSHNSLVIMQHLIDHPIFEFVSEVNYQKFYENEIEKRSLVNYPPCTRFAEIEIRSTSEKDIEDDAEQLISYLIETIDTHKLEILALGPVSPMINKIQNTHMRKIYLKSPHINQMLNLYRSINKNNYQSQLFFTPNPIH